MSCYNEAGGASHDHGHDHHSHHGHEHDHSDELTPALQNHIYQQIEFDGVRTLNEGSPDTGRSILKKTWAQRLDTQPELQSDADEQLIIHIPFAGQVRLHSLLLRTSTSLSAPSNLQVFINRDDLDFDNIISVQPTQTFLLSQTNDVQEIAVKRALFNTTRSLTLFFDKNFGTEAGDNEELTAIGYIGFRGDFMKLNREAIEVLYESAARPSDHKVAGKVGAGAGSSDLDGAGRRGF